MRSQGDNDCNSGQDKNETGANFEPPIPEEVNAVSQRDNVGGRIMGVLFWDCLPWDYCVGRRASGLGLLPTAVSLREGRLLLCSEDFFGQ